MGLKKKPFLRVDSEWGKKQWSSWCMSPLWSTPWVVSNREATILVADDITIWGNPGTPHNWSIRVYQCRVDINGSRWSASWFSNRFLPQSLRIAKLYNRISQGDWYFWGELDQLVGASWMVLFPHDEEWWNWGSYKNRYIRWNKAVLHCNDSMIILMSQISMLTVRKISLFLGPSFKLLGGIVTTMGYHSYLAKPSSSSKWVWHVCRRASLARSEA